MPVIHTQLTDGTPVCIRRVRPDDEQRLKEGIALLTPRSRYLRFFSGMREAPQRIIDQLIDADGHDHIAWGALRTDRVDTPALGIVHAFRNESVPAEAEFSVAVIDAYHGLGLARLLTTVLLLDCRREGLQRLSVNILAENAAARALVRSLGAAMTGQAMAIANFEIDIDAAIQCLRDEPDLPGMIPVFETFAG